MMLVSVESDLATIVYELVDDSLIHIVHSVWTANNPMVPHGYHYLGY